MIHYLKTEPAWFEDLWYGRKTAEIRKNDRDYQVGDLLILGNGTAEAECLNALVAVVTHITGESRFLQDGYVMLSLTVVQAIAGNQINTLIHKCSCQTLELPQPEQKLLNWE